MNLEKIRSRFISINNERVSQSICNLRYVQQHYPDTFRAMEDAGDMYMKGFIKLPGTGGEYRQIGQLPDWLEIIGNEYEYTWQLNRMPHWFTLIDLAIATGEQSYLEKVVRDLEDWLERCPPPNNFDGASYNQVDPWRILEVGIRPHESWGYLIETILASELIEDGLLSKLLQSLHRHGEILFHVAPKLHTGAITNHYIMEMLGLLWIAKTFPEFPESVKWRKFAIKELNRCIENQMTKEGAHNEGCPMYHNGAIRWFSQAIFIEGGMDYFPKEYIERLSKGLQYSLHSLRPTGTIVPAADSKSNAACVMGALYGYVVFGDMKYLKKMYELVNHQLFMEVVLVNIRYIRDIEQLMDALRREEQAEATFEKMNWQKTNNQAMYRTDWTSKATSLFFTCNAPIISNHAHMDLMSFDLTSQGKTLLVDPGVYTYRDSEERYLFKSSGWHNALTINNKDHFKYLASFRYEPQKAGYIVRTKEQEKLWYVIATHYNYLPIVHTRMMALVEESYLLIVDRLENLTDTDDVKLHYHFDSTKVTIDNHNAFTQQEDVNVSIMFEESMTPTLTEGAISDLIDEKRSSTILVLDTKQKNSGINHYFTLITFGRSYEKVSTPIAYSFNQELKCRFTANGNTYELLWKDNEVELVSINSKSNTRNLLY